MIQTFSFSNIFKNAARVIFGGSL